MLTDDLSNALDHEPSPPVFEAMMCRRPDGGRLMSAGAYDARAPDGTFVMPDRGPFGVVVVRVGTRATDLDTAGLPRKHPNVNNVSILRFGLDLIPVASVVQNIADHEARYIERVYTAGEVADSRTAARVDARRLAERFAVKEATLKVLPASDEGIDFRSIELVCDRATGRLGVAVHGRAAELAAASGITRFAVSITSDERLAAAVVAAEVGDAPVEEEPATTR
jgi:holo-[acyl-carrier protein] synthase